MKCPYILEQKYPIGDVCVVAVNLADFDADPTGERDSAPALQAAIDASRALGGGTVYIPEGRYRIATPVTLRTAVTLRGEWVSPENPTADLRLGTILEIYVGRDDPDGTPAITMEACSGIQCMTFYYPEQRFDAPVPYSPTVRQHGVDSMTLENVTMINPWRGAQCGPDANELHFLHNVYITPMNVGFFMDMTTDIGRMQNLNIKPDYYARFLPDTDLAALREYMLQNATGVYMARSDWEYGYEIHVEWCHIGFLITSFTNSGPNTQLSGLRMFNCDIGFHLIDVNPYGVALSDSEIICDRPLTAAVASDNRFKTVMQLNGCELRGPYRHTVDQNGDGQISFVNTTLADWSDSAILATSGGLTFMQCKFEGKSCHLDMKSGAGAVQILGCEFDGEPCFCFENECVKENLQFSAEPLNLNIASRGGHLPCTTSTIPGSTRLFNVIDYGAVADNATDNTAAFTAALDAAKAIGGGVVYVPAGLYRFDGQITVPTGVQLRGVFATPCHTLGGGSVLLTYANRGTEDGTPFISLEHDSGLFGLSLYYPEQSEHTPVPYPYCVRSLGYNCYIINTVLVNPWLGVDFATNPSNGHYISYISGAPIKNGIYCGNNSGDGWVENIQFNPHYLYRSPLPNHPTKNWTEFWHNQIKYLCALVFGYNEREHLLGTFVFAAQHGLHFVMQDGKGCSGKFIGHGTDGGQNGLYIEGCGELELINTQLVTIEAPTDRSYFLTARRMPGRAVVYNTLMWGDPFFSVIINGGDVTFQQLNIVNSGKVALNVYGGKAQFESVFFYRNRGNVLVDDGAATCTLLGCMTNRHVEARGEDLPVLESDIRCGDYTEKWSFSKYVAPRH